MTTTATVEMVTSADGTPIAYERTGSGPPLVLVHGATVDRTTWTESLPFLEEYFTVYALDRRGRGESGDAEDYALEREVEDVVAVVESVDEPVSLLGHSYGGLCSLEAALATDRVRRLVLYEPGAVLEATPEEQRALEEIRNAIDGGDREAALVVFYRVFANLTETELEHVRSQPTWSRRVDAVHTVFREMAASFEYELDPERFRGTTTPTLLLVGEESSSREHDEAETVCDALPDCRVATLEDQQHVAYRTAPERFTEAVTGFLTGSP